MEKKLGRYRKGVKNKDVKKYGDYVKIKTSFDGHCTLCHEPVSEGMDVGYNKDRMPGCKIAHISCVIRSIEKEK